MSCEPALSVSLLHVVKLHSLVSRQYSYGITRHRYLPTLCQSHEVASLGSLIYISVRNALVSTISYSALAYLSKNVDYLGMLYYYG